MKKKSEEAVDARHSIRPKSTFRKLRSAEQKRSQTEPVQERSRKRNEDILNAAAMLLESVNIEDMSHSDIADISGVSKAAVYYHYRTIAALQLALGRRYDAAASEYLIEKREEWSRTNWQDYIKEGAWLARDWFNAHRPACETLLGPFLGRESRLAGIEYNTMIGVTLLEGLKQRFIMPEGLEDVVSHNGDIVDTFWSRSYLRNGTIDEQATEESIRASIGYLGMYIPKVVSKRV